MASDDQQRELDFLLKERERLHELIAKGMSLPILIGVRLLVAVASLGTVAIIGFVTLRGLPTFGEGVDRYEGYSLGRTDELPIGARCDVVVTPGPGGCDVEVSCDEHDVEFRDQLACEMTSSSRSASQSLAPRVGDPGSAFVLNAWQHTLSFDDTERIELVLGRYERGVKVLP